MRLLRMVVALAALWATPARAYPWMVRHYHPTCATCHVSPSGAGLLTPYGRAQMQLLLPTQWTKRARRAAKQQQKEAREASAEKKQGHGEQGQEQGTPSAPGAPAPPPPPSGASAQQPSQPGQQGAPPPPPPPPPPPAPANSQQSAHPDQQGAHQQPTDNAQQSAHPDQQGAQQQPADNPQHQGGKQEEHGKPKKESAQAPKGAPPSENPQQQSAASKTPGRHQSANTQQNTGAQEKTSQQAARALESSATGQQGAPPPPPPPPPPPAPANSQQNAGAQPQASQQSANAEQPPGGEEKQAQPSEQSGNEAQAKAAPPPSSQPGEEQPAGEEYFEPSPGLASGWLPAPPSWLNLGASFRGAYVGNWIEQAGYIWFPVLMVLDLRAELSWKHFHAQATIGYDPKGALLASLTPYPANNLISRTHWIGFDARDQEIFVRMGRIEVPFGLRNVEHVSWVRTATRTDINEHQQYGLTVALNWGKIRGEVMSIWGNFMWRRPEQREMGYSVYAEYALRETATVGVSSLVTFAEVDRLNLEPNTLRQAHGVFARWAIIEPLVVLAESDFLVQSSVVRKTDYGETSFLQLDYEPLQGVHLIGTGETLNQLGVDGLGGWLSAEWFILPNVDIRVDNIFRRTSVASSGPVPSYTFLAQVHLSI